MSNISVIIIAKNEEARIADALRSVQWADEIIVVDSFSTDKTIDIAKSFNVTVYERAFDDFSSQKNYALSKCSNDWVLSLDCDERISIQLRDAMISACNSASSYRAYKVRRINTIFGKELRHAAGGDYPIRLFKKNGASFQQPIHEVLNVKGDIGLLDKDLIHISTQDIESEYKKTEQYTEFEARWLLDRNIRPSLAKLYLYPVFTFFNIVMLNRGFLDGYQGLLYAFVSARYSFIKYLKARKLFKDSSYLEDKISERFNELHEQFPDSISSDDARLKALLGAIGSVNNKRVLEVGCGKGRFLREAAKMGAYCVGMDVSENFLKEAQAKKIGTFIKASATNLPFGSKSFDVIYAVEVIEHLPDLGSFLEEARRVLRDDGKMVVIDRNMLSINNRRLFVPNLIIKKYHEIKNSWMYPRGFPYTEQWFLKPNVSSILKKYFCEISASYVMSDSERRSRTAYIFKYLPASRHFVLWKASRPKNLSPQLPNSFVNTQGTEKEFYFGSNTFKERVAVYPKIADALNICSGLSKTTTGLSYPDGHSNIFSLRIDADEIDNEDFLDYIEVLEPFKDWTTIFCCASSFIGKEDLLKKCASIGFDMQSHGYYHHLYNDYSNNLYNIGKAKSFFEKLGIETHGFAAPMGRYNDNLIKVLEDLKFVYSSDFAFDYLNMPHYPIIGNRISNILEVPIFPICPELLFANGLSEREVIEYFDNTLCKLKAANIPIIFYAHTDKRYPQVKFFLKQLLEKIKNDKELYKCNMSEFVKWCRSVEDEKVSCSNGLLNSNFYSGYLKMPDKSLLGEPVMHDAIKKMKLFAKDVLDFETITPPGELKGNRAKNGLKVFLRGLRSDR